MDRTAGKVSMMVSMFATVPWVCSYWTGLHRTLNRTASMIVSMLAWCWGYAYRCLHTDNAHSRHMCIGAYARSIRVRATVRGQRVKQKRL